MFLPEEKQAPSAVEVSGHFQAKTLFKVNFPGRVIGVRVAFDFGVSFNWHASEID